GAGGVVTNQTAGVITAYRGAISAAGSAMTVTNNGTVQTTGTPAAAGFSSSGGTLINNKLITSASGAVNFRPISGTVDRFGPVLRTLPVSATAGAGVYLGNGGQIVNESGATIYAVRAAISLARLGTATSNATVTNFGTVIGQIGVAIGTAGSTGDNT